jgi:Copper amine oxidase, enzyme domain
MPRVDIGVPVQQAQFVAVPPATGLPPVSPAVSSQPPPVIPQVSAPQIAVPQLPMSHGPGPMSPPPIPTSPPPQLLPQPPVPQPVTLLNLCAQNPALCVPSICLQNPAQCGIAVPTPSCGCEPHSSAPAGAPAVPGASAVAYQQFPPSGPMKTAWFVTFDHAAHRGFYITSAYFKSAPNKPWLKILDEAGPGELFVPYQPGSPRYLDLSNFTFPIIPANQKDAGSCGKIVGNGNTVVREVVDKGVLWKNDQAVYRGHKMTLWATLDAANYNYIFSYAFHDDGVIEFRAAATAINLPGAEKTAHMHNVIWRVNVDLNGGQSNSVVLVRHQETTAAPSWTDVMQPFNNNQEGSVEWNAREFNHLHVTATNLTNGNGSPAGYMIMPFYRGVSRHQESYMQKDMWVTRYHPGELSFPNIANYANGEAINNADVVLWLVTPTLHIPRDEDGRMVGGVWSGVATTMWSGFDMKPYNIFDTTPFYP